MWKAAFVFLRINLFWRVGSLLNQRPFGKSIIFQQNISWIAVAQIPGFIYLHSILKKRKNLYPSYCSCFMYLVFFFFPPCFQCRSPADQTVKKTKEQEKSCPSPITSSSWLLPSGFYAFCFHPRPRIQDQVVQSEIICCWENVGRSLLRKEAHRKIGSGSAMRNMG